MEPEDIDFDAMLEIPAFLGGANRNVSVVSSEGLELGSGSFVFDMEAPDCTLVATIDVDQLSGTPYVIEVGGMVAAKFSDDDVTSGKVTIQNVVSISVS